MKPTGYLVMDRCDDWEQALRLIYGEVIPAGGILDWAKDNQPRAVFASRAEARAAIERTEHYRLAFGAIGFPEKKLCKIVPVVFVAARESREIAQP